jgi:hypothetical protein
MIITSNHGGIDICRSKKHHENTKNSSHEDNYIFNDFIHKE